MEDTKQEFCGEFSLSTCSADCGFTLVCFFNPLESVPPAPPQPNLHPSIFSMEKIKMCFAFPCVVSSSYYHHQVEKQNVEMKLGMDFTVWFYFSHPFFANFSLFFVQWNPKRVIVAMRRRKKTCTFFTFYIINLSKGA